MSSQLDIVTAGGKVATVSGTTLAWGWPRTRGQWHNIVTPAISDSNPHSSRPGTHGRSHWLRNRRPTHFAGRLSAGRVFSLASGDEALIVSWRITPLLSARVSVCSVGSQMFAVAPIGYVVGKETVSPGIGGWCFNIAGFFTCGPRHFDNLVRGGEA